MSKIRLQKLLAQAGIASRRRAEDMIRAGEVTVGGAVVSELGVSVDPQHDRVEVHGKRVRPEELMVVDREVEVRHLAQSMDAGISPPGAVKLDTVFSRGFSCGRKNFTLNGACVLLNLPAAVAGALVLDGEFESWHNGYRRRNALK